HVYKFNKDGAALDLLEGVHLGGGSRGTGGSASAAAAPLVPDLASGPWVTGTSLPTTSAATHGTPV
ncbi:hypothetical protein, partial [Streptomyces sp. SID13726]|uniref:hypothetical protein n=1 Tax=Streptomyces sp. SID13726 TaxID=2706058 RepID=UPI0013BD4BC2